MEKRETWVWLIFGGAIAMAMLWEAAEVRVPISEIFGISRSVFLIWILVVYAAVAVLFLTGLKWSKYIAFGIAIICFLAGLAGGIWLVISPRDISHPYIGSMITLFSISLWSLAASVVFSPWPVTPVTPVTPITPVTRPPSSQPSSETPPPSSQPPSGTPPPSSHFSSASTSQSLNVSSPHRSSPMTGRTALRDIAETLDKFFPSMDEDDITSSMQVEAARKICPSCSSSVPLESESCPGCGADFPVDYEQDILMSILADIGKPTSHRVSALKRLLIIDSVDQDLVTETLSGELVRPAHAPILRVELLLILDRLNKPLAREYARKMMNDHFQVVRRAAETILDAQN